MNIGLKININVAAAPWSASVINAITDQGAEGFSSQALQQGGIGLLLTVLIISVPPLVAAFFQGTAGAFYFNSAFGHGGGARQGPNGQLQPGLATGGYGPGNYSGHSVPQAQAAQSIPNQMSGGFGDPSAARLSGKTNAAQADALKTTNQATRS